MRVIALSALKRFSGHRAYADAREPLLAWYRHAVRANWRAPADVKRDFGTASILRDGRVVFNIRGNKYRLVVWINYPYRVIYVRFIGTHAQYDRIDAQTVEGARRMEIKPIRTKADYRKTLKEIETLMHAEAGTPEGERLDVLATLVEAYERKQFPMDLPDPVEAIKFSMEQSGLGPKDLVPMIGQLNRVYEILNRRRPLTLKMVWRLHRELGIPAESLIKQDERRKAA